jgi:hypothetical protein
MTPMEKSMVVGRSAAEVQGGAESFSGTTQKCKHRHRSSAPPPTTTTMRMVTVIEQLAIFHG